MSDTQIRKANGLLPGIWRTQHHPGRHVGIPGDWLGSHEGPQKFMSDLISLAMHIAQTHPVVSQETCSGTAGTTKAQLFLASEEELPSDVREAIPAGWHLILLQSSTAAQGGNGRSQKGQPEYGHSQRRRSHRANGAMKGRS